MSAPDKNHGTSRFNTDQSPEFDQQIRRILEHEAELIRLKDTCRGSFQKTVTTETGERVTWWFPLASGLGSSFWESRYKKQFAMPLPGWVHIRSPIHIWKLCELAVMHDRPLPEKIPWLHPN